MTSLKRLFHCPPHRARVCEQVHLVGAEGPLTLEATHIISALPLPVLDSILLYPSTREDERRHDGGADSGGGHPLPHLLANPYSTITVLNLVFAAPPAPRQFHPPGFGYLIPRPEGGYDARHVPGAGAGAGLLGVVFDTASLPEQDGGEYDGAGRFVKMSAMLGGPYASSSSLSDEEQPASALLASVLPLISAQLGGSDPLPTPVHYAVHRNVESIPMYLVGHPTRMEELRRVLREKWGGRLKVVGAGADGVSVSDCIKAGRQAGRQVAAYLEEAN